MVHTGNNVTFQETWELIAPAAGPDFRPDAYFRHGSTEAEESTRQNTLSVYNRESSKGQMFRAECRRMWLKTNHSLLVVA
jgi:hypothetical protein